MTTPRIFRLARWASRTRLLTPEGFAAREVVTEALGPLAAAPRSPSRARDVEIVAEENVDVDLNVAIVATSQCRAIGAYLPLAAATGSGPGGRVRGGLVSGRVFRAHARDGELNPKTMARLSRASISVAPDRIPAGSPTPGRVAAVAGPGGLPNARALPGSPRGKSTVFGEQAEMRDRNRVGTRIRVSHACRRHRSSTPRQHAPTQTPARTAPPRARKQRLAEPAAKTPTELRNTTSRYDIPNDAHHPPPLVTHAAIGAQRRWGPGHALGRPARARARAAQLVEVRGGRRRATRPSRPYGPGGSAPVWNASRKYTHSARFFAVYAGLP